MWQHFTYIIFMTQCLMMGKTFKNKLTFPHQTQSLLVCWRKKWENLTGIYGLPHDTSTAGGKELFGSYRYISPWKAKCILPDNLSLFLHLSTGQKLVFLLLHLYNNKNILSCKMTPKILKTGSQILSVVTYSSLC